MRKDTRAIIDAIDRDMEEVFIKETEHLDSEEIFDDLKDIACGILSEPLKEPEKVVEDYSLGMESMDTAKKMLIEAAEKGSFTKWVATNPEVLSVLYGKSVPTAREIIARAKKVQLKALTALDNWDHERK